MTYTVTPLAASVTVSHWPPLTLHCRPNQINVLYVYLLTLSYLCILVDYFLVIFVDKCFKRRFIIRMDVTDEASWFVDNVCLLIGHRSGSLFSDWLAWRHIMRLEDFLVVG